MPDVEELRVGMSLDASGVESGAQRAEKALDDVAKAAQKSDQKSGDDFVRTSKILQTSFAEAAQSAREAVTRQFQGIGEKLRQTRAELAKRVQVFGDNPTSDIGEQWLRAKDALRDLELNGFSFGNADFDAAYQDVVRLTQAVREYKDELAQPETTTPYQDAVNRLFEARGATDQLKDAFRGVRDVGAGAFAAVAHPIRSLNVALGTMATKAGQAFSKVSAAVRTRLVSGLQMAGRGIANVAGRLLSMSPGISILRGIANRLRGVRSNSDGASGGLAKMVRQIRNINIAGMAMRGVTLLFGRLRSVVQEYLSQNQAAQNAVNSLKSAFANALAPAINIAINALNALMPVITAISNAFATLVTNLFGAQWTTISGATGAASAVSGVADATRDAAAAQKEYNNEVYGFDQITKQSDNSSGSGGSGGGGGGGGGGTSSSAIGGGTGVLALFNQFSDLFTPLKNAWDNVGAGVMKSVKTAFGNIKQLAADVGTSFRNVWTDGTGQRYVESLLTKWQSFIDIVSALVGTFDEAWNEVGRGEGVIRDIFDSMTSINNLISDIGTAFTNVWNNGTGKAIWGDILDIIGDVNRAIGNVAESFRSAWNDNGRGEQVWQAILTPIKTILDHIHNITSATAEWASKLNFGPLLDSVKNVLDAINPIVDGIGQVLEDIWVNVVLPLGQWLIESGLPDFLNNVAGTLRLIGDIGGKVIDSIKLMTDYISGIEINWDAIFTGEDFIKLPDLDVTAELSTIWAPGSKEKIDAVNDLDGKTTETDTDVGWAPGAEETINEINAVDGRTTEMYVNLVRGNWQGKTVQSWTAQYAGEGLNKPVDLSPGNWQGETVQSWTSKFSGENVKKGTDLIKGNWKDQSVGGWVNDRTGGNVKKAVDLVKGNWRYQSVGKWTNDRTGGNVKKAVNLAQGWKGTVAKALGLDAVQKISIDVKKKLSMQDIIKPGSINLSHAGSKVGEVKAAVAARGGIVDAATLFGGRVIAGEAGREAILPLENNTEWMNTWADKAASAVAQKLGGSSGNGQPIIVKVMLPDGRVLGETMVDYLDGEARQGHYPLAGVV